MIDEGRSFVVVTVSVTYDNSDHSYLNYVADTRRNLTLDAAIARGRGFSHDYWLIGEFSYEVLERLYYLNEDRNDPYELAEVASQIGCDFVDLRPESQNEEESGTASFKQLFDHALGLQRNIDNALALVNDLPERPDRPATHHEKCHIFHEKCLKERLLQALQNDDAVN